LHHERGTEEPYRLRVGHLRPRRTPDPTRRLQVAFEEEWVVQAEYVKEGGVLTNRRLEPHALVINWPAWYLLAYDHLRGEPRTFRLDRFVSVEIEATTFRSRTRELVHDLLTASGVTLDRV
jgi:predicted DNA-binding transcriptional regulator YafY